MAEGDIWISKFFSDSRYVQGLKVNWDAPGWRDVAQKRSPPPETLPLPVYAELRDDAFQDLPPVFQGGGVSMFARPLQTSSADSTLLRGVMEKEACSLFSFIYMTGRRQ